MSPIEKKWPFILVVSIFTTLTTMYVMDAAGLPRMSEQNFAQFILYFFCFFGVWRMYSLLGWMLVLWISPATVTGMKEPRNG